jgi:hypothetical protein
VARQTLPRATFLLAAVALAACGSEGSNDIEASVAERHAAFPSEAQPPGTPPWPEGRFAGDCVAESGSSYLCFYEDDRGRQGYVCLDASAPPQIVTAAGAHDPRRRFDHDGRALPPGGRCPAMQDS